MTRSIRLVLCVLLVLNSVHALLADFPYPAPAPGVDPNNYHLYMFRPASLPLSVLEPSIG